MKQLKITFDSKNNQRKNFGYTSLSTLKIETVLISRPYLHFGSVPHWLDIEP